MRLEVGDKASQLSNGYQLLLAIAPSKDKPARRLGLLDLLAISRLNSRSSCANPSDRFGITSIRLSE